MYILHLSLSVVMTYLYQISYKKLWWCHFMDAFDVYLLILRNVQMQIDIELGQSDVHWQAQNACPCCHYKVTITWSHSLTYWHAAVLLPPADKWSSSWHCDHLCHRWQSVPKAAKIAWWARRRAAHIPKFVLHLWVWCWSLQEWCQDSCTQKGKSSRCCAVSAYEG